MKIIRDYKQFLNENIFFSSKEIRSFNKHGISETKLSEYKKILGNYSFTLAIIQYNNENFIISIESDEFMDNDNCIIECYNDGHCVMKYLQTDKTKRTSDLKEALDFFCGEIKSHRYTKAQRYDRYMTSYY
jgi:hypothetical protein